MQLILYVRQSFYFDETWSIICYMFLSKMQLQKLILQRQISIEPFDIGNIKEASYTFTLHGIVKKIKQVTLLDVQVPPDFETIDISENGYILNPGDFAIFFTKEKVTLNGQYVCLLSCLSKIAQIGLNVTQGSFFAEPDTNNRFVLEVTNTGPFPVILYSGTKIIKGIFSKIA